MLDKSIEFKSIILMCENNVKPNTYPLPEGYTYRYYEPNDEYNWANIELSVLELDNLEQGINHVKNTYIPYMEELKRRMVFIIDPNGVPCALLLGGGIWVVKKSVSYTQLE